MTSELSVLEVTIQSCADTLMPDRKSNESASSWLKNTV